MAGDIKTKWGTSNQAITVTLASLANGSARQSAAIDFSSLDPEKVLVSFKVKTGASGVAANGVVNVYVLGTVDGGSSYAAGGGGSDAAFTIQGNEAFLGCIQANANASSFQKIMELSAAFNGAMPDHVQFVLENKTGAALDSTEGNHSKAYQIQLGQYT